MANHIGKEHLALFSALATSVGRCRNLPVALDPLFWPAAGTHRMFDDDLVFLQVLRHKLVQDVHSQLENPPWNWLSDTLRRRIGQRYLLEQSAKQRLARQWTEVHEQLIHVGIQAMVVKGPASSIQLYGNATARGFTDLDILVDTDDLSEITPILEKCGYQLKGGSFATTNRRFVQKAHHLVFHRDDTPFRLEIHDQLFGQKLDSNHTTKKLFGRMTVLSWSDVGLPTLSMADQAMFMIDHGTRHGWILLHWLADVAAVLSIQNPELHDELADKLIASKRSRQFSLAYALCKTVFPIALPHQYEPILTSCHARHVYQLSYSRDQLALGIHAKQSGTSIMAFTYLYQLPMARSTNEKLDIALRLWKIAPLDMQALPVPDWLVPIHVLLRPIFVLRRRLARKIATWRKP